MTKFSHPIVFSSQVKYSGDVLELDNCSITICNGDSLNEIIETLYTKLCEGVSECKIKVTEDDECCDFLDTKISSEDGSIIKEVLTDETTGCQTLDLSVRDSIIVQYSNSTSTDYLIDDADVILYNFTLDPIMVTDGDELVIQFIISTDEDDDVPIPEIEVLMQGTQIFDINYLGRGVVQVRVLLHITRNNSTTVVTIGEAEFIDPSGEVLYKRSTYDNGTTLPFDMGTTVNPIIVRMNQGVDPVNVTAEFINAKYFKA